MPDRINTIPWNNFGAGWCPSDDAKNGRKNALLRMSNVELDKNGALKLIGGAEEVNFGFPANAHTLYSRVMQGSRKDYAALADGSVYRGNATIITGGDHSNAAFVPAFDYTLIASGTQRKKDTGSTLYQLGLDAPVSAPTFAGTQIQPIVKGFPLNAPFISIPTGTYHIDADNILRLKADSNGIGVLQSWALPDNPYDWSIFDDGGLETDNDRMTLFIGSFVIQNDALQIDFILEPLNISGQYENFYTHTVQPDEFKLFYPEGAAFGAYEIQLRRSQFDRVGDSPAGWENVYGYRIVYTTPEDIGLALGLDPDALIQFVGGSNAQEGIYQYAEMFVSDTGLYQAKSELGPASAPLTATLTKSLLNIVLPTDPQVNEIWIFRRSVNGQGLLDQWYRVKVIKKIGDDFGSTPEITVPGIPSTTTPGTVQPPNTDPNIPNTPVTFNATELALAAGLYQDLPGHWVLQGGVDAMSVAHDTAVGISAELWMIFQGLGFVPTAQVFNPPGVLTASPTPAFLEQWPQEAAEIIRRGRLAGII